MSPPLQKRFTLLLLLTLISHLFFYQLLQTIPHWPYANRWLAGAFPITIWQWWLVALLLPTHRRPSDPAALPYFGLANNLTLGRGVMLAWLTGFILAPQPLGGWAWLPVLVYFVAASLDLVDGYVARKTNLATPFGGTLDMEYDALGIALITLLAIRYEAIGLWYLLVAFARYGFMWGIRWRQKRGLPVYELSDSQFRRPIAGFQMGFLSAMIWPIFTPAGTMIASLPPFLATMLTFGRDWLVVSGRLDPHSAAYQHNRQLAHHAILGWLPVGLRLVVALTLFTAGLLPYRLEWAAVLSSWGWSTAGVQLAMLALQFLTIPIALAIVAGFGGRWMPLLLTIPIGLHLLAFPHQPTSGLLLFANLSLVLTNSGYYALWIPAERYMFERLGGSDHA